MGDKPLADIPGNHRDICYVKAHAAATATERSIFWLAPFACEIKEVNLRPTAAVTGDDTNTTNLNLLNGGATGAGTTELANYDMVTGANLTADVEYQLFATSTAVAVGVALVLQHEKVNTGVDVPDMIIEVVYESQ